MTDSSLELPSARSSGSGPGRLIRQARESAKLSIEDLAAGIKLSRHTVDALERDDFATLKEPVYVRGYYRKLSKVLALSEAELIASYDAVALPKVTTAPSKLILAGNQDLVGSASPLNKALVAAGMVVTALVIALAAFWATRRAEQTEVAVPTPAPQVQEPVAPPPAAAPAPVAPAPAAAVTPDPAAAVPAATDPAAAVAAPATAVTAAPAPAVAGEAQVSLEFVKESWAQIEDADGKRLAYAIFPAGENLNLSGKPPFAITLGRASVVQLKFNGTPVDMTAFTLSSGKAVFSLP